MSDCSDVINPGLREFLKEVKLETEALTDEWVQAGENKHGYKVV